MKFNGSEKQNKWAVDIIKKSELSDRQIDGLLRWAGPTMYRNKIMDVTIIIENRDNLADYADGLGRFLKLTNEEKHTVAVEAADELKQYIRSK